ncbi:MAG: helix-turn-helix transcriptional regulator [Erysipelotrichaceae bacterium]|nr:helix-turn-helix transcriptional regulator [Erysipelotrichaceae bacterium]
MKGTLSERLSDMISARGMTQKELATKSEVTEAAMSHYIKGDRTPRASVLGRIAEALGTTTDYLLYGDATDSKEEIAYAKRLIARNVSGMSKEDKMSIMSILFDEE